MSHLSKLKRGELEKHCLELERKIAELKTDLTRCSICKRPMVSGEIHSNCGDWGIASGIASGAMTIVDVRDSSAFRFNRYRFRFPDGTTSPWYGPLDERVVLTTPNGVTVEFKDAGLADGNYHISR